ncbi:nucleoside diphosphate kinase regulator [Pleomorphomonas sp. JP5]|uniref:nucleoside diphosphate kinase regulator n=1 Tax=Pleomorphomonas sp. JP5 TaxID=2942998 RepID=UPI002044B01C|nr:nucleoside diphosphate kinase regulator [Pleomorphomonas sp. JP5]MCM5559618.1 nucleoside diphosphate kinase regulator [Pleomorphomonas sp. JP5]
MTTTTRRRRLPAITLARSDHERLANLADALADRDPKAADQLAAELDRARVVADNRLAEGTVRMGAVVRFSLDGAEPRTIRLVYPGEADIEQGRISVLTPVGAALIGLTAGQSIDWADRDGKTRQLQVLEVGVEDLATAS